MGRAVLYITLHFLVVWAPDVAFPFPARYLEAKGCRGQTTLQPDLHPTPPGVAALTEITLLLLHHRRLLSFSPFLTASPARHLRAVKERWAAASGFTPGQLLDPDTAREVVMLCCAIKPLCGWNNEDAATTCRERCGGQVRRRAPVCCGW